MRTDLRNVTSKKYLIDFSNIILFQNIFKPIRVINLTDSQIIWTRLSEDIYRFTKLPSLPSQKFPSSQQILQFSQQVLPNIGYDIQRMNFFHFLQILSYHHYLSCIAHFWVIFHDFTFKNLIQVQNEDSYFKIRTKWDFSIKVEKKFLDVVWQYWKYLEASPEHGGHFLSLRFFIWSL